MERLHVRLARPSRLRLFVSAIAKPLICGVALSMCASVWAAQAAPGIVYTKDARPCIVIPQRANAVEQEAANELAEHLALALGGAAIQVVKESGQMPGQAPKIFLGATQAAKEKGVSLEGVGQEGFRIKTLDAALYILGRDNPTDRPSRPSTYAERGTLNGVYTFLEDYVGVRWFLPGPHGRVVEPRASLAIPAIDVCDSPYFKYRSIYGVHYRSTSNWGAGFNIDSKDIGIEDGKVLWRWMRRMRFGGASNIPANHSTIYYKFFERFGKTKPEWFAMRENGTRCISEDYHRCFLNWGHPEVVDEHVRMALDHFSGEHKILKYYPQAVGDYFVVMPNDSYLGDYSPESQKRIKWETDTNGRRVMNCSDLIFWHINEVARRVRAVHPQAIISICAYSCYREPPSFPLEKNIQVRLCIAGAYNHGIGEEGDKQMDLVKRWKAVAPRPLTIWGYQLAPLYHYSKIGMMVSHCPHAMAAFYKAVKPYSYGSFLENESAYFMREHLNRYVYLKLMWNPDLDVDALLSDYYSKAYGPGAPAVRAFYDKWERLWAQICQRGTRKWVPKEVWEQVMTPAALGQLRTAIDKAGTLVSDPAQRARLALLKKWLYDRVLEQRREYDALYEGIRKTEIVARRAKDAVIDGKLDEPFWRRAAAVTMHDVADFDQPLPPELATTVRAAWDDQWLYLAFECNEPTPDQMRLDVKADDDVSIWQDSGVEVFLVPGLAGEDTYYQLIINALGHAYDTRYDRVNNESKSYPSFNMGARIKTSKLGAKWIAELAIPFRAFGDVKRSDDVRWRLNLCRNRAIARQKSSHYSWSNVGRAFNRADRFGRVVFYDE